jgi:glycerate 2-kinase
MKIRNMAALLSSGDRGARKVVLDMAEMSLLALDSYHVIRNLLKLEGKILHIGNYQWDISTKRRVYVVGAGKACNAMAMAVDEVLGPLITKGIVIVKKLEEGDRLQHIELIAGGHPLPNQSGWRASQDILQLVDGATPEDLFIGLISGGSSALMSCPIAGITLEDEIQITDQLLKCSARILEINAIRRHISATNGGRLAQKIEAKGAELINLIISDSVGDKSMVDPEKPVAFFGTPVAPDRTTIWDAQNVLNKFNLLSQAPKSIVNYIKTNDPARETPKSFGSRVNHFVLRGTTDACEAVLSSAGKLGLPGMVLTTLLEGESREAGTFLATIAKEVAMNQRPLAPPCVLIAGGETTTAIEGPSGQGGPSQELALGFALEVNGRKGMCIAAIDTDGTDGPSDFAGGIADGYTVERARSLGIDVYSHLKNHDSSSVLTALDDAIVTGNTGTNVCDVTVIYIA